MGLAVPVLGPAVNFPLPPRGKMQDPLKDPDSS
jgi:hypothetical protein